MKLKEYILKKNDPFVIFYTKITRRSHRFAISSHGAKRKKVKQIFIDQIDGIGKTEKRSLLNHFGSARSVESAGLEDFKICRRY